MTDPEPRSPLALLRERVRPPAEPMDVLTMAQRLGLTLEDGQVRAVQSGVRQLLLNISRQGDKSAVAALLAIHEIISRPNARVSSTVANRMPVVITDCSPCSVCSRRRAAPR